jgi:hypothetical protein
LVEAEKPKEVQAEVIEEKQIEELKQELKVAEEQVSSSTVRRALCDISLLAHRNCRTGNACS